MAPFVASMTVAAASSPASTARAAPTSVASVSAGSRVSTAITLAGVSASRIWMARCPRPPAPITTACEPGVSLGKARLTARYGVSPASVNGAASTGSRSPSGTSRRGSVTSRYSAMAPSTPNPMPGGPSIPWMQRFSAPAAHGLHCPQPSRPYTATGSPGSNPRTRSPARWTQPAASCPMTKGGPHGAIPSANSRITCRSEWQAPAPPILTTTCPGPGSGSGRSTSSGSDWKLFSCSARTSPPLVGRRRLRRWCGQASKDSGFASRDTTERR